MGTYDAGTFFYVRPIAGCTVTAENLHETLRQILAGSGIGITGANGPEQMPDGTYEIRTFGPAGAEGVLMVLRHEFWEVVREESAPDGIDAALIARRP